MTKSDKGEVEISGTGTEALVETLKNDANRPKTKNGGDTNDKKPE